MTLRALHRIWLLVGLGALSGAIVLALATTAGAQTPNDTPAATARPTSDVNATPTEEPTPGPEVKTLVKITVDPGIQPIPKGHEFEALVSVEQVEHLAGFEFVITYDPKKVEPVKPSSSDATAASTPSGAAQNAIKTGHLGEFLKSSGRQEILCNDPQVSGSTAVVGCNLLGAPVCAGGVPGVSGDGIVGSVLFKAKGGGTTTLDLDSKLVLDDIPAPCDLTDPNFTTVPIPHRSQGTTIELKKSSGTSGMLIVGIVVVVAVVVVGGGGGYLMYRRRQS